MGGSIATTVPEPASLPVVDATTHTVNLCVLVVGAAAENYLGGVQTATSQAPPEVVHLAELGEASFLYLPLRLGEVRGWTTRLHLYGFANDARLVALIQRYGPRADGVVVAEPAGAAAGEATMAIAACLARTGLNPPVAVFGDAALAHRWSSLSDYEAMHVAEAATSGVLPTLKTLTSAMLARVSRP